MTTNCVVDLRSGTKQAVQTDPNPGMALWEGTASGNLLVGEWQSRTDPDDGIVSWDAPLSTQGYLSIGDPGARMPVGDRNTLAGILGLDSRDLPESNFTDILFNFILGSLGDPTGISAVRPPSMM